MKSSTLHLWAAILALLGVGTEGLRASAQEQIGANRLTYLDGNDPFYPGLDSPRLATPQWIGEPAVEAVVVLAIDDMRDPARYESFLRPILERLKQIDGRAPVSILANAVDPTQVQLQTWVHEGLSLEVHTLAHPCPCLAQGSFDAAANTYHGCVDLMSRIPGNRPVAFRMPCCDSMNSPSPRFYAEIFNRVSAEGRFLTIDSSVMNILTSKDKSLPRELVLDRDGHERFRKYLPVETNAITRVTMKSFVTTIEDYPYPYVVGRLCWEFPAMVPSDWEAQNVHGVTNAITVADWKAALDATVIKQGVFTFIFHPHGWIRSDQLVEFIEYAVQRHGTKVKFLTFREAQDRLDQNLLTGHPLRGSQGDDNGVRLLDVNRDEYLDVVIGNRQTRRTRVWNPQRRAWAETGFPVEVSGVQFGVWHDDGRALAIRTAGDPLQSGAWHFDGGEWREEKSFLSGLELQGRPISTIAEGRDTGVRLRDVDRDGRCEVLVGNPSQNAVFGWSGDEHTWKPLPFALPAEAVLVDAEGRDNGLRFVDVNRDGYADILHSNADRASLHLFIPKANPRLMWRVGWNDEVFAGKRDEFDFGIPRIVRSGERRNNGAWFSDGMMWIQNEDTAHLPDKVDRRTFRQLLTADQPVPMTPAQSVAAMRVRPGFTVELVAAEPLVRDPIAFDWSADGRLWVVEMGDYPAGVGERQEAGGTVRVLEDVDGDGRYDKSTAFLESLKHPTGIIPWRQGVIVSAAPDVFYAEDSDGDGRADVRKVLLTGFTEGNPQHLVNGFDYGLDNWLYGANGDSGGEVRVVGTDQHSGVNLRGRDFRFRPDELRFETQAGQTQFGRHRDDWGNWFGNNNPTWLWHFVLPEHYLTRNTNLLVRDTKRVLADRPNGTRLYPASRTRQRFNDHHQFNHVTSANSPMPYRDELFGPEFATSVFISDPVHNLVHREVLESDGVTFKSHRASDEIASEFLASADSWFRPTMLKTGPDGALYIADMYRLVLEHPEWIPDPIESRLDLRAGADLGRIYRVYPKGATLRTAPRMDRLDAAGLAAALDSPNGWQRDTAQRLLVHRRDLSAVPALLEAVRKSNRPLTRLQALWTLEGLGAVEPTALVQALEDSHPSVREAAVRVSEVFAASQRARELQRTALDSLFDALLKCVDDPSARVRHQLALTLGEWQGRAIAAPLVRLALRNIENDYIHTAVLSSASRHAGDMLRVILADDENRERPARLLEALMRFAVAQHDEAALAPSLRSVRVPRDGRYAPWQFRTLTAFLDALDRRGTSLRQYQAEVGTELRGELDGLNTVFVGARKAVEADALVQAPETAAAAVALLGRDGSELAADLRRLTGLLRPQIPLEVQRAVLDAVRRSTDAGVARLLLSGWSSYLPALREDVLKLLFSRSDWSRALMDAVEQGEISPAVLGPVYQQQLLSHPDDSVRRRAGKLLETRGNRHQLLLEYQQVAALKGDVARGELLFKASCAVCHRLRGEGQNVGPELDNLVAKPIDALLVAILDPNQAVEWRYVNYQAVMKSGLELSGVIVAETPTSITLKSASGREETVLRGDVERFESTRLSLMPEGFEQSIKPQDMADLLVFLRKN